MQAQSNPLAAAAAAMTPEQIQALIASNIALQAKVEAAEKPKELTLKVSEKGALSLYGMGRFPVTLYPEQWQRIISSSEKITGFIEANKDKLKFKA